MASRWRHSRFPASQRYSRMPPDGGSLRCRPRSTTVFFHPSPERFRQPVSSGARPARLSSGPDVFDVCGHAAADEPGFRRLHASVRRSGLKRSGSDIFSTWPSSIGTPRVRADCDEESLRIYGSHRHRLGVRLCLATRDGGCASICAGSCVRATGSTSSSSSISLSMISRNCSTLPAPILRRYTARLLPCPISIPPPSSIKTASFSLGPEKKLGHALARPKFREETPRRRTVGPQPVIVTALHNLRDFARMSRCFLQTRWQC